MGNHWAFASACALALSACPSVDLGDEPADIELCNPNKGIAYFQSDIMPTYLELGSATGCAQSTSCHDNSHNLTLDTTGDVNALASNYRLVQGYLNCGVPMASQLLTHPLEIDPHPIMVFPNMQDPRVIDFLAWFQ